MVSRTFNTSVAKITKFGLVVEILVAEALNYSICSLLYCMLFTKLSVPVMLLSFLIISSFSEADYPEGRRVTGKTSSTMTFLLIWREWEISTPFFATLP